MCFSSHTSRRFQIRDCLSLTVLAILVFTTSCATHTALNTTDFLEIESSTKVEGYVDSHEVEKRIRNEYKRWKGTRHRLGGTGHGGIDCSGFVRAVYKNVFNIELPRSTKEQVKEGTPIRRDELYAGDLVFFKPPTFPHHVGIFLSRKEFVHASKSKGVIISQISPDYWDKYYCYSLKIF